MLQHSDDVAQLLASQGLSIGAVLAHDWRCCIGIPTVCVPIADNQQFNDAVIAHYQLGERLSLCASWPIPRDSLPHWMPCGKRQIPTVSADKLCLMVSGWSGSQRY